MDSDEYDQLDSEEAAEMDADPTANNGGSPKSNEDVDTNFTADEIMQNEVVPQLSSSGELPLLRPGSVSN